MFKRFKIGGKILGGYMIVIALLLVVAGIGILGIRNLNTDVDEIIHEHVPAADAAMEMMIALISTRDLMGEYWINEDAEVRTEMEEEFEGLIGDFDEWEEKLREVAATKEEIEELETAVTMHVEVEKIAREYMDALDKELLTKEMVDVKMEEYDSAVAGITGAGDISTLLWMQAMAANDFLISGNESLVEEFETGLIRQALDNRPGDTPTTATRLDRCLEAAEQIDRNANQTTLIETWLDDLAGL